MEDMVHLQTEVICCHRNQR